MTTTTDTDRRPELYKAFEHAAGIIEGVRPGQLAGPSPCAAWDVAELIDHIVFAANRAVVIGRGDAPVETGTPHVELAQAAAEVRRAGKEAAAAWSDGSRLLMQVKMPWGESYPGSVLVDMYLTELATHTWDLAAATGQLERLDPWLAASVIDAAQGMLKPEYRNTEGSPFGPEVDAPEGATTWERVAAFLGRHPR
jgi:uncharacterized protein (TIGR03086 family)